MWQIFGFWPISAISGQNHEFLTKNHKNGFCLRIDQYWYEVKAPVLLSHCPKVPGGHAFRLRVVRKTK